MFHWAGIGLNSCDGRGFELSLDGKSWGGSLGFRRRRMFHLHTIRKSFDFLIVSIRSCMYESPFYPFNFRIYFASWFCF